MLSIRPAAIADAGIIHSLANRTWREVYKEILTPVQMEYMLDLMYSHEALVKQISKPRTTFLIVSDDEEAVGFAAYYPRNNDSNEVYHLDKIYVLPNQHGKGTGKKILEHIIDTIQPLGCHLLDLNVNRYNKAISFYEKLGFIKVREVDVNIGGGYFMNDYIMEKRLA